jgi:O-methyltransferase
MRLVSRALMKRALPGPLLDGLLLLVPRLYSIGPVMYETSLDRARVDELLGQLRAVRHLPGDVIEAGSSRCGASILMAMDLRASGVDKRVLACDTYEGFDRAELAREREAGLCDAPDGAFTSTSLAYVRSKLAVLGMSDRVIPVPGPFSATLPGLSGPFCMVFVDCDLRDSLVAAAEALWPRLSPGGRLVFDDYGDRRWGGARLGVDEFVSTHGREIREHGLVGRLYAVAKR